MPKVGVVAYGLKYLIGRGAKAHLIGRRSQLIALIKQKLPNEDNDGILAEAVIEEIRNATKRLPVIKGEAVRHLLMLTKESEGQPAWRRRQYAAKKLELGIGHDAFKKSDGDNREIDLMRQLATVLIEQIQSSLQAPYVILHEARTYRISDMGALIEESIFSRIKITREGFPTEVQFAHEYFADQRNGVLEPVAWEGCRIISWKEPFPDRSLITIRMGFPKLSPPQEHVWAYKVKATSDMPVEPHVDVYVRGPTNERQLSISFDSSRLPRLCWHYANVPDEMLLPGEPPPEQSVEPIGSTYSYSFTQLEQGTWHGIAWRW